MQTNNIGKYMIQEDSDAENRITNVTSVFENNSVSIKWDFPKNPAYKLAVIFWTADTGMSLRELILSGCESTTLVKNIQTEYTHRLKSDVAFMLYPAAFSEGDEINIIDQRSGNVTPLFSKLIKVTYSISYNHIYLSNFKTADISISASEPVGKNVLYYKKLKGNQEIARYPLDPAAIKSSIISSSAVIRSGEIIKICCKPGNRNIELIETLKSKI